MEVRREVEASVEVIRVDVDAQLGEEMSRHLVPA